MMEATKFKINGIQTLKGTVEISGAKNAALPIIAATILSDETIELSNVPKLVDIENLIQMLKNMGANAIWSNNRLTICNKGLSPTTDAELSGRLRASILLLGPILAKNKEAKIHMPGGCNIGSRPIDIHLKGLEKMGAKIHVDHGYVHAKAKKLVGADIYLDFPSVGGTENLMMAATLAEGTTTLTNVAEEPEIVDLANFLNSMGARVLGAGTNKITIHGVQSLNKKAYHSIIPDRIEAGTFLIAAAMNRKNKVIVQNVVIEHLHHLIEKLSDMGVKFKIRDNSIEVIPPRRLHSTNIKTMPYPGFSTDLQPQMMTILAHAEGISTVKETIFENRLNHVGELNKTGANIEVDKNIAIISGKTDFTGAVLRCFDLRAGISMVVAALNSKGESTITDIYHIMRGYEDVVGKFRELGAKIDEMY